MNYCKGDKCCKCGCLVCIEFFPLILEFLCILVDFPVQIATIRMGLSIICFKGSHVDFPNKYVLQSLNIAFIIANSADPDEMQHYVFTVCQKLPFIQRVDSPLSDKFNQGIHRIL